MWAVETCIASAVVVDEVKGRVQCRIGIVIFVGVELNIEAVAFGFRVDFYRSIGGEGVWMERGFAVW